MIKFSQDVENADILNTFFFDLVESLKISEFEEVNLFAEKISQVFPNFPKKISQIFKYSKQPSIQVSLLSIMSPMISLMFQFSSVSVDDIFTEFKKTQDT